MGYSREEVVDTSEVGLYHCVNRCVRQDLLLNAARKAYVQNYLAWLISLFAVEMCSFALMSNHYHLIVRTRCDVAETLSDREIARRWRKLFPKKRNAFGADVEPGEAEIAQTLADPERVKELRSRISNLSWFMRCFNEHLARHFNWEDGKKGRFWEGRFSCKRVLDDVGLLTCMVYVDLNPIRAGVAATPETSIHTSVFERIQTLAFTAQTDSTIISETTTSTASEFEATPTQNANPSQPAVDRDGWLAPIPLAGDEPAKAQRNQRRRATNEGLLPTSSYKYIDIVDQVGRIFRIDKPCAISPDLAPIWERLGITPEHFFVGMQSFQWKGRRVIGHPDAMSRHAEKVGIKWFHGIRWCRNLFGKPAATQNPPSTQ